MRAVEEALREAAARARTSDLAKLGAMIETPEPSSLLLRC